MKSHKKVSFFMLLQIFAGSVMSPSYYDLFSFLKYVGNIFEIQVQYMCISYTVNPSYKFIVRHVVG